MDVSKRTKQIHKCGPWFAAKRKNANLTQKALAEAVGVDRSYIAQIERGLRWPSKPTLYAIWTAMGVRAEDAIKALNLHQDDDAERVLRLQELVEKFAPLVDGIEAERLNEMFKDDYERWEWLGQLLLKDPAPQGPDGWRRLNTEDRRLVQRVVNRILDSYETEGPDANQAK